MEDLNNNSMPKKRSFKQKLKQLPKITKIMLVILLVGTPVSVAIFFMSSSGPMTQFIITDDGIRLATDIYLPNNEGSFPALLFRTPYGKSEAKNDASFYNGYGVAYISQDHRGVHDSNGIYAAFGMDGPDARDTVEWLETQPWYNGKFATQGGSARGITQYMSISYYEPVCQLIEVATPDLFGQALFLGGAPQKLLAQGWLAGIGQEWYYFDEVFNDIDNESEYAYQHRVDSFEWSNVTWPSIHIGGWYDCFQQGIIDGFMGYQYHGGTGGAGNAHLIMGPWTHSLGSSTPGQLTYPSNANSAPYYNAIFESMFGTHLLGMTELGNHLDYPEVQYYIMGDVNTPSSRWNCWAQSEIWPISHTDTKFYFHSDHKINQTLPITSHAFDYEFDPSHPITTLGGCNLWTSEPWYRGPYDQRPVYQDRTDFIEFTMPIVNPLNITGRMYADLYVSSNCTDTDFTVKLIDVYPDGREMMIADGIQRMRYRNGLHSEEFMDGSGSTIYPITLDLWSSAYVFNSGHTLKVVISSSNYPRFDVNPNTGDVILPFDDDNAFHDAIPFDPLTTEYNIAQNKIIVGPGSPSCLILPIPTNTAHYII